MSKYIVLAALAASLSSSACDHTERFDKGAFVVACAGDYLVARYWIEGDESAETLSRALADAYGDSVGVIFYTADWAQANCDEEQNQ